MTLFTPVRLFLNTVRFKRNTTEGGYIKGSQNTYDKSKALDLHLLRTFIINTQPKAWKRFCQIYGDSNADAQLYNCNNRNTVKRQHHVYAVCVFRAVSKLPRTSQDICIVLFYMPTRSFTSGLTIP